MPNPISAEMPATPPIAGDVARPPEQSMDRIATSGPITPEGGAVNNSDKKGFWTGRKIAAGAAVVALAFGGIGYKFNQDGGGDSLGSPAAAGDVAPGDVEVCPEGIYPDGEFEATDGAYLEELYVRPTEKLGDTTDVVDFLFGDAPGVSCRTAAGEATLSALYNDLVGGGNAGLGFEGTDINEQIKKYQDDHDVALNDNKILANGFSRGRVNEEPINEPTMYRPIAKETGNEDSEYEVAYIEQANVTFSPGEAYVLTANDIVNDGDRSNINETQKFVIDLETGQIFVLNAIGAPIEKPAEAEQGGTDKDGEEKEGQDGGGGSGDNKGTGGGHGGDEGGGCGESGCGGGDECGGCGGGKEGGEKPGKPKPVVPVKPIQPAPTPPPTNPQPTTPPPTTSPPTTPPPTAPPTTPPKGPEPTPPTIPPGY